MRILKKSKLKSGGYHQLQNAWKNNDSDGRGFGSGYFIETVIWLAFDIYLFLSSRQLIETVRRLGLEDCFQIESCGRAKEKTTQTKNKPTTKFIWILDSFVHPKVHAHSDQKSR